MAQQPKPRKFKKIYYVLQTKPIFAVCGQFWSRKEAESATEYVKRYTGEKGRIVEFSHSEIKELNFGANRNPKSRNKKR